MDEHPELSDERREELNAEYFRLWELRDSSEGHKILYRNHVLTNSYRVFQGNHAELYMFLSHIASPAVTVHMWAEKHRYRLDYAKQEAGRLFHNYVASALSLVDTTRTFVGNHYAGTDLFVEYKDRVKRDFAEAPLHRFMQKLRVYTLHYQLPPMKAMNRFKRREDGGTDFDNAFWLNVDKLREWNDWTGKAREYLEMLGSEAKLTDIINDYEPVVTEFHKWLSARIWEEHAASIEETFDLERRMQAVDRQRPRDSARLHVEQELPGQERMLALLAGPSSEAVVSELATIDNIIASLYEFVSFPYGGVPNLDRFRSLFVPDAPLIEVEADGTYLTNIDDYIRDFHKMLNEGAITTLSEFETARRAYPLGDVAHVLSFHETRYVERGEQKRRHGLYDLHLVRAGERWAITSMHLCDGYSVRIERSSTTQAPL